MARNRRQRNEVTTRETAGVPVVGVTVENAVTGIYPEVKNDKRDEYLKANTPVSEEMPVVIFLGPGGSVNPLINGKRYNIAWERIDYGGQSTVYRYATKNQDVIGWLRSNGYKEKSN